MSDSYRPWWCQPENVRGAVFARPAHIVGVRTASSRVIPGVWVVSCRRSLARIRRVGSLDFVIRLPSPMLLVELGAFARDPVVDEPPQFRVVRQLDRHAVAVRALERDVMLGIADGEHRHVAALAVRGAIRSQDHLTSARRTRYARVRALWVPVQLSARP